MFAKRNPLQRSRYVSLGNVHPLAWRYTGSKPAARGQYCYKWPENVPRQRSVFRPERDILQRGENFLNHPHKEVCRNFRVDTIIYQFNDRPSTLGLSRPGF